MQQTKQTWWCSSERHHIYYRWCLLVLLNASYPFILSLSIVKSVSHLIGIALAVISFIIIYAELDDWLLQRQHQALSKQLRISASIKIATILLPFIDIVTGSIAIETTRIITGINVQHFQSTTQANDVLGLNFLSLKELVATYLTTMIDGLLLSLFVALLIGLIRLASNLRQEQKAREARKSINF